MQEKHPYLYLAVSQVRNYSVLKSEIALDNESMARNRLNAACRVQSFFKRRTLLSINLQVFLRIF